MSTDRVVEIGRMLSDTTRVTMLDAMFDGRDYTVTELARHADPGPNQQRSMSASTLVAGQLATMTVHS
jgi:hypothetical protein